MAQSWPILTGHAWLEWKRLPSSRALSLSWYLPPSPQRSPTGNHKLPLSPTCHLEAGLRERGMGSRHRLYGTEGTGEGGGHRHQSHVTQDRPEEREHSQQRQD